MRFHHDHAAASSGIQPIEAAPAPIMVHSQKRSWTFALSRLPKAMRGHLVAMLGEFIGTTFFFLLAFGGAEVATISSRNNAGDAADSTVTQLGTDQLLYISCSFGFALTMACWSFFRVSGGLFNPAVSAGAQLLWQH